MNNLMLFLADLNNFRVFFADLVFTAILICLIWRIKNKLEEPDNLDNNYKSKSTTEIKGIKEIKEYYHREGNKEYLFVLLHGWTKNTKFLSSVAEAILDQNPFKEADIIIPELPLELFSTSSPEIIARDIVLLIDYLIKKNPSFADANSEEKKIYFVGHSLGALLARKAYLYAYGEVQESITVEQNGIPRQEAIVKAPFDKIILENGTDKYKIRSHKSWVTKVNRIILLAGLNRGWSNNPASKWLIILGQDLAVIADTLFYPILGSLLIFKMKRNSRFITNLRVQWTILSNYLNKNRRTEVQVIQLLGTQDGQVSPKDNIDFVTGQNFRYREVINGNHYNIINLHECQERRQIFQDALIYDPNKRNRFNDEFLEIGDLDDQGFPKPDTYVTDVVFVIHGIRDQGFWTKRIARKIRKLGDGWHSQSQPNPKWRTESSTYGYFGMIPFLSFYLRRNKVEWLMERYVENLALYPNANFHYVGHSNGTYLVAKALQEYPCCRFKNIVFAGSVVSSTYDWQEKIDNVQVKNILNYVATGDCIVGIFPNLFENIPFFGWNKDLGGAGNKGFDFEMDKKQSKRDFGWNYPYNTSSYAYETNNQRTINQLKYVVGGHGAALKSEHWDTIGDFIVKGPNVLNNIINQNIYNSSFNNRRDFDTKLLSKNNLIIWGIILFLVFIILPFLIFLFPQLLFVLIFGFGFSFWFSSIIFSVFPNSRLISSIILSPFWGALGFFLDKLVSWIYPLIYDIVSRIISFIVDVVEATVSWILLCPPVSWITSFISGVICWITSPLYRLVAEINHFLHRLFCEVMVVNFCPNQLSIEDVVPIVILGTILVTLYLKMIWQILTRI